MFYSVGVSDQPLQGKRPEQCAFAERKSSRFLSPLFQAPPVAI
jgi:hypothetical protein